MKNLFLKTILFLCCAATTTANAQDKVEKQEKEAEGPYHKISLVMAHAHIREGIKPDGGKGWLSAAAWELNYDYFMNEKWAIGLHNDIIMEEFSVKNDTKDDEEILSRTFPIATCAAATFKPGKHAAYMLGFGGEFAKEGNYFLTRIGFDYGWEIPKDFTYDFKWNAYDTWVLGFGISKILRCHKIKP